MNKLNYLMQTLSDGEYHSGEELGNTLGVTRAAIWKLIKTINEWGVEIESSTKKGYRFPNGIELLDKQKILKNIQAAQRKVLQKFEIFDTLDSTNDYLMQTIRNKHGSHGAVSQKKEGINPVHACLAERQTAGKGRRGRPWLSPFGTNIYLSLLWQFSKDFSELAGLSLVIAIAVIKALQIYGVPKGLALKWPNDVLWQHKKLAGILIETRGESNVQFNSVIGVGLNVQMPKSLSKLINQPWTDLSQILSKKIDRNKLCGLLLDQLIMVITQFEHEGLKPFIKQWRQFDITFDQKVAIHTPTHIYSGIARGVDEGGNILLESITGNIQSFSVGEISLRLDSK